MDSWLNMVLMCGLLLIATLQTTNSFRFRRSEKIKSLETNIHHLQKDYVSDIYCHELLQRVRKQFSLCMQDESLIILLMSVCYSLAANISKKRPVAH